MKEFWGDKFTTEEYQLPEGVEGRELGIIHTFQTQINSPKNPNYPPMNLIFTIKEKNMRKLNSHL